MDKAVSHSVEEGGPLAAPSRREQSVEVAVFVFLILPSLILSFFAVGEGNLNFLIGGTAVIFRELALVALVLFFLWHNGEPVQRIGWRCRPSETVLGLPLLRPAEPPPLVRIRLSFADTRRP